MKKTMFAAVGGFLLAAAAAIPAQAQLVVRVGPPPRVVERRPPPPFDHRDWAWHAGYHRWDGNRYIWVPGSYVAPPRPHAIWVEGRWVRRGGGWYWREGHWR